MNTLHLVLKAQWYDMIASGEKTEEYREVKWFWVRRLMFPTESDLEFDDSEMNLIENYENGYLKFCRFDAITFTLGYPKKDDMSRRMTFKIEDIHFGTGKPEWGAEEGKQYFVIKLGERIYEEANSKENT